MGIIFFLVFAQKTKCGYLLEPPHTHSLYLNKKKIGIICHFLQLKKSTSDAIVFVIYVIFTAEEIYVTYY